MEKEGVKKTRWYRLRLDPETHRKLRQLAESNYRSMRAQLVVLIHEAHEEMLKQKAERP